MYTPEQRAKALEAYDDLGHVSLVIRQLGYPSKGCLRLWIAGRNAPKKPRKPKAVVAIGAKLEALGMLERGFPISAAARYAGVTTATLLNWRRIKTERGADALMTKADVDCPDPTPEELQALPDDIEELKRRVFELEFENRLMREVVDMVKKDPRVDPRTLSNREKTLLIDAMRGMYSLSYLEFKLGIADSSYRYAHRALASPDKWEEAANAVVDIFEGASRSRGYRYVHHELKEQMGDNCPGEKKVRELMAEHECVVVYVKKRKRWSSYEGEISEAPPNLLLREDGTHDFSASAPNEKWLTDITEFSLPDDERKVYLSPLVDCFAGELPAWSIGMHPTADLANKSLSDACACLAEGESPIIHDDRGCHYRWPGWISICEEHGLVRSMSRKGTSPDNAACEGFFGRLKNEFFYGRDWSNVRAEEFMDMLDKWLVYYNEKRVKESLNWMAPMEYRRAYLKTA